MVLDLIKQGHPNADQKVSCSAATMPYFLTPEMCLWLDNFCGHPYNWNRSVRVVFVPAHGCLIVQHAASCVRCGTSGHHSLPLFRAVDTPSSHVQCS